MTAQGAAAPGATLGKCGQFGMSEQAVIVQGVLRGQRGRLRGTRSLIVPVVVGLTLMLMERQTVLLQQRHSII